MIGGTMRSRLTVLLLLGLGILSALVLTGPATVVAAQTPVPLDDQLARAAGAGNADEVRRLLAAGARVNAMDQTYSTPLAHAVRNDHLEVVEVLLAAGANVNTRDFTSASTLHMAAAYSSPAVLQLLLDAGADVNSVTRGRHVTPLHSAAIKGRSENVRVLLAAGSPLEQITGGGETALLLAIRDGDGGAGYVATVQVLMDAGAHAGLADAKGVTPLVLARERGQTEIVAILEGAAVR
jgi:uncharacterized protein